MTVIFTNIKDVITIGVEGRFDYSCHKDFRNVYEGTDPTINSYIVDLKDTDYIDSSALGMLLLLREYADSDNINKKNIVEIINVNTEVRDILKVSNFDKLFNME